MRRLLIIESRANRIRDMKVLQMMGGSRRLSPIFLFITGRKTGGYQTEELYEKIHNQRSCYELPCSVPGTAFLLLEMGEAEWQGHEGALQP